MQQKVVYCGIPYVDTLTRCLQVESIRQDRRRPSTGQSPGVTEKRAWTCSPHCDRLLPLQLISRRFRTPPQHLLYPRPRRHSCISYEAFLHASESCRVRIKSLSTLSHNHGLLKRTTGNLLSPWIPLHPSPFVMGYCSPVPGSATTGS